MYCNVYVNTQNLQTIRVIWEGLEDCVVIDINDPNAWPFMLTTEDLSDKEVFKKIEDPFPPVSVKENSVSAQRRDEAYEAIFDCLDKQLSFTDKKLRNQLIKEQINKTGKPRIYILRKLRAYWQRGLKPNALASDYANCGVKGKPRRKVKNKLGRKRKYSSGTGIIVTDEIADLFDTVLKGFYLPNHHVDLVDATTKIVSMYKSRYPHADASSIPTLAQVTHFHKVNTDKINQLKMRHSKIEYQKDIKPVDSTATKNEYGPGSRYEIDATIVDLHLVSTINRYRIIGRPVIYYVRDVFSRMIVGLYVGLDNPSWATATMALANAFCDKVEFCRQYGIEIEPEEWSSVGIPASIRADRGEMLGKQADLLTKNFGIKLSITRAFRGDDKGVVERGFREMHAKIKPYVDGVVEAQNGKKRTGRRYELDAMVSLFAFTQMMIYYVLHHNNNHVVSKYDFSEDMPTSLPSIPIELWNWGISNRGGKLRSIDKDLIEVNLLPQAKAKVSDRGIKFQGIRYSCFNAKQLGWFHRTTSIKRPEEVTISYDTRNTNFIYLRADENITSYWICEIKDESRRYKDMTFQEAKKLLDEQKTTIATKKQKEDFVTPNYQNLVESIAQKERDELVQQPNVLTDAQRLGATGDARKEEKNKEHQKARDKAKTKSTNEHSQKKSSPKTRKFKLPPSKKYLGENNDS